jgi:transposase
VLSDLESSKVTIKSYSYRVKRDRNTKGISMVTSITLYLYDGKLVSKKLDKRLEGNYDQLNSLTIFLETPIEFKSIHSLLSNNKNGSWKTEIRDFFATKRISEVRFSE